MTTDNIVPATAAVAMVAAECVFGVTNTGTWRMSQTGVETVPSAVIVAQCNVGQNLANVTHVYRLDVSVAALQPVVIALLAPPLGTATVVAAIVVGVRFLSVLLPVVEVGVGSGRLDGHVHRARGKGTVHFVVALVSQLE